MIRKRMIFPGILFFFFSAAYAQPKPLTLSEAIETALKNNYGIIISRAQLDAAALNNHWGSAGRYPSVGFSAGSTNSYDFSDNSLNNRLSAGLGLDWILFDGFSVQISKSLLENTEELTSGRLAVVIENSIQEVILGYYGVLLEEERLGVLKTVMMLSKDRYDYEIKRKDLGSAVTYQVLQAENSYLSDKAALLEQEMQVRNARRNFNFILGQATEERYDFIESFSADTSRYILSDLQNKMLSDNQTLQNQYTSLLLRQDEVRLKESAYYPTIGTSAGIENSYTRMSGDGALVQNSGSIAPYANLRLTFDLYNGGVRKRALKVARISEEIQQTSIDEMKHSLVNELFNLFDYHQVRIALLNVAEKNLAAAELNLRISEEKYRTGVINSFNYRDVQMIYLEASLRRLQAIYNLVGARASLTRITGGFIQAGKD